MFFEAKKIVMADRLDLYLPAKSSKTSVGGMCKQGLGLYHIISAPVLQWTSLRLGREQTHVSIGKCVP